MLRLAIFVSHAPELENSTQNLKLVFAPKMLFSPGMKSLDGKFGCGKLVNGLVFRFQLNLRSSFI